MYCKPRQVAFHLWWTKSNFFVKLKGIIFVFFVLIFIWWIVVCSETSLSLFCSKPVSLFTRPFLSWNVLGPIKLSDWPSEVSSLINSPWTWSSMYFWRISHNFWWISFIFAEFRHLQRHFVNYWSFLPQKYVFLRNLVCRHTS